MPLPRRLKFVLDTNCFIDAARDAREAASLEQFSAVAAPGLYLSAVVAAELRAGAGRDLKKLERDVFAPYIRRGRVLVPSASTWNVLGTTLSQLAKTEGLILSRVQRSFVFDIMIAHSCRESGAVMISKNTRDIERISRAFKFEFAKPYPGLAAD